MATTQWLESDYYDVLGVAMDASDDEIRSAYRELARTAHPDINPDDATAEDRFKQISAAYDVVGDAEKRAEYDEFRQAGNRTGGFDASSRYGDSTGFDNFDGRRVYYQDFDRFNVDDFFGSRPHRGRDVHASLRLPLVDAVYGATTAVEHGGEADCDNCDGAGIVDGAATCSACAGHGRVLKPRRMKIRIPAGVEDGQTIRLPGRGGPGINGGPAGDLYVEVGVEPHAEFGRKGKNLTRSMSVSFADAALGGEIAVPTLDGESVTVRIPAGTQGGQRLRVSGQGVPSKGGPGDLLVSVQIAVPTELTDEQRDLISQIAA